MNPHIESRLRELRNEADSLFLDKVRCRAADEVFPREQQNRMDNIVVLFGLLNAGGKEGREFIGSYSREILP